jgi:hypothetical protein
MNWNAMMNSSNSKKLYSVKKFDSRQNDEIMDDSSDYDLHSQYSLTSNNSYYDLNDIETSYVQDSMSSDKGIEHAEEITEQHKHANTFFDTVLPSSSILSEENTLYLLMVKLLREHDWLAVWSYPSTILPRRIRWIGMMVDILLTLFIDTIFFQLQYPPMVGLSAYINSELIMICSAVGL